MHGDEPARLVGLDLERAAQLHEVVIDRAGVRVVLVAPRLVEQDVAAHHLARPLRERLEDRERAARQLDPLAIAGRDLPDEVDRDAAELKADRLGDLDIDLVGQVATRAGKRIELPSRAFAILKVFAKRPGEVVSRDVLLDEAWGYEDYPNTRTVDNHLVKLRKALEDEPDKPRFLVTIHGAGYKLDVPREAVRWAGDREPA